MSSAASLEERLGVLRELASITPGRIPPEVASRVEVTEERARSRLAHGRSRTVVALAGATGSGKSSVFNALVGSPAAVTGVRRPTTSSALAAVFGPTAVVDTESTALLDWLEVATRHPIADRELDGLLLLDLPDHDSTAVAHRSEVDRLVQVVDVFVWIVDPQKYADAALHHDYLQRFAGHAGVTIVVLNQIDRLAPDDRRRTIDDLARLLRDDGLDVAGTGLWSKVTGRDEGVRILATSARSGEGVGDLRRELAARVAERRAVVARIEADLDWIASDVRATLGDRPPGQVDPASTRALGAALGDAIGVDAVADAVGASHRRRGQQVAGWPPLRWVSRLRPDPLGRLGLGGAARRPGVDRTTLPPATPVASARVRAAVRAVADAAGRDLPAEWRRRVVDAADVHRADLDDALDRAVGAAEIPVDRPGWWRAVGAVQWAFTAAMVIGLVWLLAIGVVAWFGLPDLPTPKVGRVPWPTVLALGGAATGLLLAALTRWANAVGASRRARVARRRLASVAGEVGQRLVVVPIEAELAVLARVWTLTRRLARDDPK